MQELNLYVLNAFMVTLVHPLLVLPYQRKSKHAVVSYEAQRIHIFLHDGQQFRQCVWHGHVTYDEKIEIVRHMMVWFNETTALPSSHLIVDHEDGTVFTDVLKEVAVEEEDEM